MKKFSIIIFGLTVIAFLIGIVSYNVLATNDDCTTIQDGLFDTHGNPLILGYDQWGYNYQAHIYNGYYENYTRPAPPVSESDTWLQMKWNEAWLSNKDCDGDGKLDRHFGYDSYIGSGAWLTNHQWGTYEEGGVEYKWNYFVKIVAAPADAYAEGGFWYTADGMEIGPAIWGAFAVIQEVLNDPGLGEHGLYYKSPVGPGFGKW